MGRAIGAIRRNIRTQPRKQLIPDGLTLNTGTPEHGSIAFPHPHGVP
jgi:hypothetical protein